MIRIAHRIATVFALAVMIAGASAALARPAEAKPRPAPTAKPDRADADDTGPERGDRPKLTGKLNLNEANEAELELLPGIGPTKAERILDFRKKNGPFKRVKDLRRVKGFGRKSVAKLEPYLTLAGPTTLRQAEE
jgi:competence protein ComEA